MIKTYSRLGHNRKTTTQQSNSSPSQHTSYSLLPRKHIHTITVQKRRVLNTRVERAGHIRIPASTGTGRLVIRVGRTTLACHVDGIVVQERRVLDGWGEGGGDVGVAMSLLRLAVCFCVCFCLADTDDVAVCEGRVLNGGGEGRRDVGDVLAFAEIGGSGEVEGIAICEGGSLS